MTAEWVLVAGDFVPTGGMDMANLGLARHLAAAGRVTVVAHRADPTLAAAGAKVELVRRPLGKHILGEPFLARGGRRAAATNPAAVAVVNGGNCVLPGAVNWVHYVHAAFAPNPPPGRLRRAFAAFKRKKALREERDAVRAARVVIANSELTKRHVVELLGVAADRVRVVYYGTDPAKFPAVTPAERAESRAALGWGDSPWAVYVGSMGDRRKGFDTLYDAWKLLCESPAFDANLAVVGRGAELAAWQGRAAADGLGERIRFLGFRSDVPAILAAADVLVHPARYEAYGLGVHEALCRGLPAIVTADAGVAEKYPPELHDLLLPTSGDPAALADRLRDWRGKLESYPARMIPFADGLRSRTWDDMAADFAAAAAP